MAQLLPIHKSHYSPLINDLIFNFMFRKYLLSGHASGEVQYAQHTYESMHCTIYLKAMGAISIMQVLHHTDVTTS